MENVHTASGSVPRDVASDLARTQLRSLASAQKSAVRANCVFALMTVLMLANRSNAVCLGMWLLAMLVLSAARLFLIPRLKMPDLKTRRMTICVTSGVTGMLWAILPLVTDLASAQGAVLLFTLCALTSGSAIQGAAYAPIVLVFVTPTILAILFKVLTSHELPILFAVSTVIYAGLLMRGAFANETRFAKSARSRAGAEAVAETLAYIAAHDALTGLINRAEFYARLEAWLDRSRHEPFAFAIYLMDIDNFKIINDSLGHIAGDEVLCEVAKRLAANVGPQDIVARLGGDEFAILIAYDATWSRKKADDLLAAVCLPVFIASDLVPVGASLGVATAPRDGLAAKDLLVAADLALYAAKEAGRQCWRCFDETLRATIAVRGDLERDLLAALDTGAIEVWFQPQVALHSARLIGLEALVRWNHPRHGFVAPPEIVAAALRLRVSRRLTGFILAKACAMIDLLEWRGFADVEVSVNVSPREFDLYDVAGLIAETLASTGVSPRKLEIEITEEAIIDGDKGVGNVARLAETGVRLAIDDFGAGNASIAYLRYLKVDRIKIDRSFVRDFADRAGDRVLVQAIIGIGRALGVEVVAEGVETGEDAVLLASLGCHLAQGYFFGRPMTEAALSVWLDDHRKGYPLGGKAALPPVSRAV